MRIKVATAENIDRCFSIRLNFLFPSNQFDSIRFHSNLITSIMNILKSVRDTYTQRGIDEHSRVAKMRMIKWRFRWIFEVHFLF